MLNKNKTTLIVAFSIFIGILVGLVIASNFNWTRNGLADEEVTPAAESNVENPQVAIKSDYESTSRAFVEIVKKVNPTVVSITSEKVVKVRNPFADFFNNDDFFRRFFRLPDDGEQEFRQRGLGSGVIVEPNGYILTNYHVIKEADEINVVIDKKEYDAKVIGQDPATDVAVIKINKNSLPVANLGDSDKLEVGEWVLAIGNPFDISLEHTVTAGIISAKGRSNLNLSGELRYQDFIQTDAAINPGNSGGALINLRGELIGLNTAIIPGNTGGNLGIGFAIPINMAKRVMDELIAHGKVIRGYLGVYIGTPDAELSEALGLKDNKGAVIVEVQENTPADKAGLRKYDVIIEVNGQKIQDDQHLTNLIASYSPGEKVNLKIVRDGKIKYIPITLGERPETRTETPRISQTSVLGRLGLQVTELTDGLAKRYGYEEETGVLVSKVRSGSIAEDKGIRTGDLIKEVNRRKVKTVREFEIIVDKLEVGEIVLFQIRRGRSNNFVAMRVPKP
ncbi:MAG: DegQ family serine endoprotease [bacterium]